MSFRTSLSAAVLIGAGLTVGALGTGSASAAGTVCDAYSGGCTTVPTEKVATPQPSGVSPSEAGRGDAPSGDLPFTGGEAVLVSVLGLGALAGGTALVVAGRRRGTPNAAA